METETVKEVVVETIVKKSFLEFAINVLPKLIILLAFAIASFFLARIFIKRLKVFIVANSKKMEAKKLKEFEKRVNTLIGILKGVLDLAIWAIVIMIGLKQLGVDIAPLIAGAGIMGIALGFGAQELVRDFISGFFILVEDQIRVNDVAIINGTGGLVDRIGLRTITLRDFTGTVHIFQNGKINTMSNMTKEWSAMVFDIGVAYKEDTDKVVKVMEEVGENLRNDEEFKDKILEPLEIFGVDKFDNSAVIIKARFKTKPIEQWGIGREYRRRLKYAFDKENIEIPFPHTTVYWGEEISPLNLKISEKE